jgi:hypothetical protein
MGIPTSRQQMIDYCLRRLGEPVIQVAQNLDPDQIDDRVDDALLYFQNYHFDGVETVYLAHSLTAQDITQEYIQIPPPVISVLGIVPVANSNQDMGFFDIQYQMRLNDLYTFTSTSIVHYDVMMRHLALLDFEFNVNSGIEFSRHQQQLHINWMWADQTVGTYIIIQCYRVLDPNQYPDIWNDLWLKEYTTELLRRQWGENLMKFNGVVMLGNVTLNGGEIYMKAQENIEKLEQRVKDEFSLPIDFFLG